METYVISLDSTPQRYVEFRTMNPTQHLARKFSAISGSAQHWNALVEDGLFDPDVQYSHGAVGCALSHLALWTVAEHEARPITICEDDAIFNGKFDERASQLIDAMGDDWDLVMWGWNFDSILHFELIKGVSQVLCRFDQARLRSEIRAFVEAKIESRLFPLNRAFGTICYSVSPRGAGLLKSMCFPIVPLTVDFPMVNPQFPNNGIDIAMNSVYTHLKAFVAFPPLVATRNEHESSTVLSG